MSQKMPAFKHRRHQEPYSAALCNKCLSQGCSLLQRSDTGRVETLNQTCRYLYTVNTGQQSACVNYHMRD